MLASWYLPMPLFSFVPAGNLVNSTAPKCFLRNLASNFCVRHIERISKLPGAIIMVLSLVTFSLLWYVLIHAGNKFR